MTQAIQTTTIIRQRGQITIPDAIRKVRLWANEDSVVVVSSVNDEEITIRPKKEVDWDKIWEGIRKARAIKGKNKTDTSSFIAQDRLNH